MKKLFYIACSIFLATSITMSCERDISSLNVNPKKPEVVPSANLVAASQQYLADQWVSPSVNLNISRFFTQQWTETQYVDETNYNFVTRNQPQNHYNTLMRDILGPLKTAAGLLETEAESTNYSTADQAKIKANKKATIELLSVFAWANLVDTFGDVPYSEALQNGENKILQPKYDDAATIYADLETRLNAALASISPGLPGYDIDLVYKGNMAKWKKFGNTLKLQMGLNLSDINQAKAKSMIESAYQDGVILTEADSYAHPYMNGQFANPVYQNLVASGRDDFIPSDVYMDYLKSVNDPRVPKYFTVDKDGNYEGGPYGVLAAYANYSHISPDITKADVPGRILDVDYTKFMLLEAAARGFNVGKTAALWYVDAVTQSMNTWGVDAADAAAFLVANPYDATNWKKSVGLAAWSAMHNRGFEAWYFFRRLDSPVLVVPGIADGLVYRMPYSSNEYSTNEVNVKAAASAIGGDSYTTKLFWDIH